MSDRPVQVIYTTDGRAAAEALVGQVTLFGGCPYRVVEVRPTAALRWEVCGIALDPHHEGGEPAPA